ncbi:zinc-dependent metalloprotease [Alistipes sp. D31t1_170403_E11]|uniref:zinc-dependent metalloprotease n=1 Tax=Alistipes sp. D31t1_170403_E11 TaxID=2787128 RepID=UPI0018980402|nr:zinc-dependent metalloprotease [Alistipes sp. D31t1_170403_E11]
MIRKGLFLACALLIPALLLAAKPAKSKGKKKNKTEQADTTSKKKVTDYEKLFKDKKCQTVKGLLTLHKVDGEKLYFELPMSVFGREMLLGSTVSEISSNDHGVIGYKSNTPLHVTFTKQGKGVQLCLVNDIYSGDEQDQGIKEAVRRSSIPGIYRAFKIEAYNADSTAVVIDATNLFMEDNSDLSPFDPYSTFGYKPFTRSTSFQKSNSHLGDIKAFDDNVTVKSYLSYTTTVTYSNGPVMGKIEDKRAFTALVTRTLLLLPEEPMRPRIADPRMNIFVTGKARFSANMNRGTLPVYYARHWRVEPKDVEAYKRGELVEPVKPIVFYLDDNLPEAWKPYAKEGIEEWNHAFEKIGFKNVVQVRDYPTKEEDPEFDPDNLKYSCIRYAPIAIQNAMGPSWDDPRTGEIINASVMVYHDIVKLLNRWRFLQTAGADPNVRTMNIPDSIMGSALRYVLSHEVGHCLGYMHNMCSSAAIPIDSLRSPSFTQKYGTTYSIMDYARFNHVAQPGDYERGVSMMPPRMGVFDEYAVKWLYTYLPDAKTPEEEQPWLDSLIRVHAADPIYRYGKQQVYNTLDPTSLSEDLGDDLVRGAEYGIKNLKFIMKHLNEWYGEDDNDLTARQAIYMSLLNQYLTFVSHVYNIKGGMMMNERKAGDPRPSYSFVDGDYQRRAQKFLVDQLHDLDWIDDPALLKELPLQGNLSVRVQRLLVSLITADKGSFGRMIDPAPNAYTQSEHSDDAMKGIFRNTIQGRSTTPRDRSNQNTYVDFLLMITRLMPQSGSGSAKSLADDQRGFGFSPSIDENGWNINTGGLYAEAMEGEDMLTSLERQMEAQLFNAPEEISGFGYFRSLTESLTPRDAMYYARLIQVRDLLRQKRYTGDQDTRNHYELLLHRIEGALQ